MRGQSSMPVTKLRPCYLLVKTECLYVATKFNDEARIKLVLRSTLCKNVV